VIGDILQPTHLLFVLVIALLVLGPKRLPEVGRSLGKGLRDFRTAISGEDDHVDRSEAIPSQVPSPSQVVPGQVVPANPVVPPNPVPTESTPPVTTPVEHTG
jgi:sec-independent protein translocase protein TatA